MDNRNYMKLMVAGLACMALCGTALAAPKGGHGGPAPKGPAVHQKAPAGHAPARGPQLAYHAPDNAHNAHHHRPESMRHHAHHPAPPPPPPPPVVVRPLPPPPPPPPPARTVVVHHEETGLGALLGALVGGLIGAAL